MHWNFSYRQQDSALSELYVKVKSRHPLGGGGQEARDLPDSKSSKEMTEIEPGINADKLPAAHGKHL